MMKRLPCLLAFVALLSPLTAADAEDSLILFRPAEARKLRERIREGDPSLQPLVESIRKEARASLGKGPWSVTFSRPEGVAIAKNDFFSEGPYWWPDPKNPNGPYIRRDGERNPNRFTENDDHLREMSDAVYDLGFAAYFLDDADAARRASEVLRVWFIDPATRMNPHLEYGQAIRGVTTGRGTGIIDTVPLIWAVQGLSMLRASGLRPAEEADGVRLWFRDYIKWLTTSEKGISEKKSGNNHSTWWAVQAAAYSLFVGDAGNYAMTSALFKEYLVPSQIQPDGSCPREEARTRSLSYSAMNLNAFTLLCRIAEVRGEDLWHFKPREGAGVLTAVRYLFPFIEDPTRWKKQQITSFSSDYAYFYALAGIATGDTEYLAKFQQLTAKGDDPPLDVVRLILAARPNRP